MGAAARGVGATNWPSIGEMDIMEYVNALSQVSHTFHCGVDPGGPCNETTGISSNLRDRHVSQSVALRRSAGQPSRGTGAGVVGCGGIDTSDTSA